MFVQVRLRLLEQLTAPLIGGFECGLAEMLFELLTDVIDTAFDLIEFIKACIEWKQNVKGAGSGVAFVGRSHFALEGREEFVIECGHKRFLDED